MGEDVAEKKSELQTYNSRKLSLWASNPQSFENDMPRSIKEVLRMVHTPPGSDEQASSTMLKVRDGLDKLVVEGPDMIGRNIYRDWAFGKKLTENRQIFGQDVEVAVSLENLSEEQTREWNVFTMIGEVPRKQALPIVRELLGLINLPDIRYIPDESLRQMVANVRNAKKEIAANVFPDITDEEAHQLFGQLTSAQEVLDSIKL